MKHDKNKKNNCPYCADASLNHTFSYSSGVVSMFLEPATYPIAKTVPRFVIDFISLGLDVFLDIIIFFRIGTVSKDIEKAITLRSKIIWKEARKRGIVIEQIAIFGKLTENFRAHLNGQRIYFESLPIPPKLLKSGENWDDKIILKNKFFREGLPVPQYFSVSFFSNLRKLFLKIKKPIIVKPRIGSRGRHTTVNIKNFEQFCEAVVIGRQICPSLVVEEYLEGHVCRATLVNGKLAGFYKTNAPEIVGDGVRTIEELITEKNKNRPARVLPIELSKEYHNHLARLGFDISDVLPEGKTLVLSYRAGRLFGGTTEEMIDKIHPSFIPVLERAALVTELPVVGFDCIIPNPEEKAESQHWGIIECNTLPFIDLHYYALKGKPRNIAGMVWDLWGK